MKDTQLRVAHYNEQDREALLRFYDTVWAPPPFRKAPAWLDWSLSGNPYVRQDSSPLLLAWSDDKVVGHLLTIPTDLWRNGEALRVAWGRDLYVAPDFRRMKLALALFDESLKTWPMVLGSGQSDSSRQLQNKYGWIDVRKVRSNERLLPSFRLLGETLSAEPAKFPKRMAAMAYGGFAALLRGGTAFQVEIVGGFAPDDEGLWEACRKGNAFMCARDAAFLAWRFDRHPYHSYVVFKARDASGRMAGYAVVRAEGSAVFIIDLLVRPDSARAGDDLVAAVVDHARDAGAVRVVCRSVDEALEASLRRNGFLATAFDQNFRILTRQDPRPEVQWRVTAMDSDQDR